MSNYDLRKIEVSDKIAQALAIISGIFLSISTAFMFANIFLRTTVDVNIRFVYDLCSLCAAGVASFAIPYATFKNAHTTMDMITSHLNPRVRGVCEGISGIITMVVMLFTVAVLTNYAYQRTLVLESTTTANMPTFIFRWLYAIGMLLTTVAAALEMIDSFRIAAGKTVIRSKEELEKLQAGNAELEDGNNGGENA